MYFVKFRVIGVKLSHFLFKKYHDVVVIKLVYVLIFKGPIDCQLGRQPCCQLAVLKEMLSVYGEVDG